jgi:U6 snRNA-associated Sm-like protein LSm1
MKLTCLYCIIANLVLQDTIERIYVGNCYGDIPRGIFLIRGENVVLLGEIVSLIQVHPS